MRLNPGSCSQWPLGFQAPTRISHRSFAVRRRRFHRHARRNTSIFLRRLHRVDNSQWIRRLRHRRRMLAFLADQIEFCT
jgi:hypothetical protein